MLYLKRIISLFWEPTRSFTSIKDEKVNWMDFLIPFLIVTIISLATLPYVTPIAIKEQIARIEKSDKIPEAQKELAIERIESGQGKPFAYIMSPVGIAISLFFIALLVQLISNFLLGGEIKYLKSLAIVSYTQIIPTIGYLIKVPLMVSKGSTQVYTSLALFLEPNGSFLFKFFNSIDIFTVWRVLLIGLGIAILNEIKPGKAIITFILLWLAFAAIIAAIPNLSAF